MAVCLGSKVNVVGLRLVLVCVFDGPFGLRPAADCLSHQAAVQCLALAMEEK